MTRQGRKSEGVVDDLGHRHQGSVEQMLEGRSPFRRVDSNPAGPALRLLSREHGEGVENAPPCDQRLQVLASDRREPVARSSVSLAEQLVAAAELLQLGAGGRARGQVKAAWRACNRLNDDSNTAVPGSSDPGTAVFWLPLGDGGARVTRSGTWGYVLAGDRTPGVRSTATLAAGGLDHRAARVPGCRRLRHIAPTRSASCTATATATATGLTGHPDLLGQIGGGVGYGRHFLR